MRKLVFAVGWLCANAAFAAPVQWTFQDVYFDDGTQITGGFIFDADLLPADEGQFVASSTPLPPSPAFFDASINTDNGEGPLFDTLGWQAFTSIPDSSDELQVVLGADVIHGSGYWGTTTLYLDFASPLTNAGGVVDVTGYQYVWLWNVPGAEQTRAIVSGTLVGTVVPIPAAVWLFGSALAGLGLWRRRSNA